MQTCIKCAKEYETSISTSWKICTPCTVQYQREYRKKNREMIRSRLAEKHKINRADPEWAEKERKRTRDYWINLRYECIMAYGGYLCACCGETEPKFMTLDHINNDGSAHRKEMKSRGPKIYTWLRDRDYPSGVVQILCMNCNHGKALNNGICPHKTSSRKQGENGEQPDRPIPCQAPEMEKV